MRSPTLAAVSALALLGTSVSAHQDPDRRSNVGRADVGRAAVAEMFQSRCSSCHQPPDPAFATDLAWLGQVLDTA